MDDTVTPRELAEELGTEPINVRRFLREPTDGRGPFQHVHRQRWHLHREEADRVRAAFRA